MPPETGLPDLVGDHFRYVVIASRAARIGQAIFFASAILLPLGIAFSLFSLATRLDAPDMRPLIAVGAVFCASLIWYLSWMEVRLHRFRTENPASYQRWYGYERKKSFGGTVSSQLKLAKLQARYVFLGKEPSPEETLDLTMEMARRGNKKKPSGG